MIKNLLEKYKSYPRSTRMWSNLFILTSVLSFFIDLDLALLFQAIFSVVFLLFFIPYDQELIEHNYAYFSENHLLRKK